MDNSDNVWDRTLQQVQKSTAQVKLDKRELEALGLLPEQLPTTIGLHAYAFVATEAARQRRIETQRDQAFAGLSTFDEIRELLASMNMDSEYEQLTTHPLGVDEEAKAGLVATCLRTKANKIVDRYTKRNGEFKRSFDKRFRQPFLGGTFALGIRQSDTTGRISVLTDAISARATARAEYVGEGEPARVVTARRLVGLLQAGGEILTKLPAVLRDRDRTETLPLVAQQPPSDFADLGAGGFGELITKLKKLCEVSNRAWHDVRFDSDEANRVINRIRTEASAYGLPDLALSAPIAVAARIAQSASSEGSSITSDFANSWLTRNKSFIDSTTISLTGVEGSATLTRNQAVAFTLDRADELLAAIQGTPILGLAHLSITNTRTSRETPAVGI